MTLQRSTPIWIRPTLNLARFLREGTQPGQPPHQLDSALFDVDGVLIDTRRSYRLAVMRGSEHLVRVVNGLTLAPTPMVAPQDIAAFKLAGGFNSDWDATQLFAALWTARLREWRGQPEASVTLDGWAARASDAARAGVGGVTWMRATFPASAIPDDETARWAHDEFYWGDALVRELYGHEPLYAPEAEGFVHNEELLLREETLPTLRSLGITRFGLITGRVGPEVNWALRRLAGSCGLPEGAPPAEAEWHDDPHGRSPFACVVPATLYAKPDPRALAHAVRRLEASAALYVGDTADDLDLALRYRREGQSTDPSLPPVLAVAIAHGAEADIYAARGADLVLASVNMLPEALARLGFATAH